MTEKTCEQCGEIIPKGRVDALPETKLCMKCANAGPPAGRRIEEGFGSSRYWDERSFEDSNRWD